MHAETWQSNTIHALRQLKELVRGTRPASGGHIQVPTELLFALKDTDLEAKPDLAHVLHTGEVYSEQ